eukprot:366411-Chlamydomonas_euryale.AAC.1
MAHGVEHCALCMAHGMEHCALCIVHGAWHGALCIVHGTWCMVWSRYACMGIYAWHAPGMRLSRTPLVGGLKAAAAAAHTCPRRPALLSLTCAADNAAT